LIYLWAFLIGGAICFLVQILIIRTKITPARILVGLVLIGVLLEGFTLFAPMESFAESGVKVPLIGFGALLARGAIEGARQTGVLGVLGGPLRAAAIGLTVAIMSGYLFALIFKARTKKSGR